MRYPSEPPPEPRDGAGMPLEALELHEATLVGLDAAGLPARLDLLVGDVRIDGEARTVRVSFRHGTKLQRDGQPLRAPEMEMPDAEILSLARPRPGQWDLIVRWSDFSRRQSRTVSYVIGAERGEASLLPRQAASP